MGRLISPMCPTSPIRSLAGALFSSASIRSVFHLLSAICYLLFAQRCASRETALIDAAAINAAGTFLILL